MSKREAFSDITVHLAELGLSPDDVLENDKAEIDKILDAVAEEVDLDKTSEALLASFVKQRKRDLEKSAYPSWSQSAGYTKRQAAVVDPGHNISKLPLVTVLQLLFRCSAADIGRGVKGPAGLEVPCPGHYHTRQHKIFNSLGGPSVNTIDFGCTACQQGHERHSCW